MTGAELATCVVLAVVIIGLIVLDLIVAFGNKIPNERDTISGRLRDWGSKIAFLPFAWGVLAGHFWLTNETPWLPQPWAAITLVICGASISVGHWVIRRANFRFAGFFPIAYLALGAILGVGLWPQ